MLDPKSKVRYRRPGKGPPWKRKKKQYEVVKLYNPGDPPECEYCQDRVEKLWKKGTISVPLHKGCTCQLTKPYWVSKAVYEGKKGPPTKKFGGEMKKAQADTFTSWRAFALNYFKQGMIKPVILDEIKGTLSHRGVEQEVIDDLIGRLSAEIDKWELYGPPKVTIGGKEMRRKAQVMTVGDEFLDEKTGELYVLEGTESKQNVALQVVLRDKATGSIRKVPLVSLETGLEDGTWKHLTASRRSVVGQEVELETVEAPELTERKCAECGRPMNPVEWMLSPGICGECVRKKQQEVTGQVEVIPSTEEKVEEEREELEQQLEEVQETLEEKEEAVEGAAEEAEGEVEEGAVEEAEVALEVAEETVEEAEEAVEGAETRTEIEQAEQVVEEAEEAVQEITAQEATKWRLYHGFDCNSETGFNNGNYLSGEYDDEDEARQAAKQHLSPYVGEWDNTDPDAYTVITGYYDELGNELSEEEYDSDNPNHSYSYQYVSVEPIYESASVARKVVSDPGWELYQGTGCSSSPAHAGCASEGGTGLRFMDMEEAKREAEALVGGGGTWIFANEYELKTGHFDKEGNPITEQEYSAGMAQTPDPGYYYMFDFVRLEPATEPPYVAQKLEKLADQVTEEVRMKVTSQNLWQLYKGERCGSNGPIGGCTSEEYLDLQFETEEEARRKAEELLGSDGSWLGTDPDEYEVKTGHFDKNNNPITGEEYSSGMAQTPDPGYYYTFDFIRVEPYVEPVTARRIIVGPADPVEAVEEAVEEVKEEFKEVLEDVKERVEEVVEKVVEEVEGITARRMTIGQDEAAASEVAGAVKMMQDEASQLRTALAGSDEALVDFARQNYPHWMDEFRATPDLPSIEVGMRSNAEHQLGILELRISELAPGVVEAAETVEEAEEVLEEAEAEEEVAEEELAEAEKEVAEAETPAEEEAAEEAVEEAEEAVEEAEVEVEEAEEELEEVQAEASLIDEMKEIDVMIVARDAKKAQEYPSEMVEVPSPSEIQHEDWSALPDDALLDQIAWLRKRLAEALDAYPVEEREGLEEFLADGVAEAKTRGLEVFGPKAKVAQHGDLGGLSDERLAELVEEYTQAKKELEERAAAPEALDPKLQELITTYEQQLNELNEEIKRRTAGEEVETPFQATRRIAALDTGTKSEEAARIIADEYRRKKEAGEKVRPLKPGRPTRIKRAGARDDRLTE